MTLGNSAEFFPARRGLKEKLEKKDTNPRGKPDPQPLDFKKVYEVIETKTGEGVAPFAGNTAPAPVEKTEKKVATPEEEALAKERLEALAKRRLEISQELENSVNLWFNLTAKALSPEVVIKEIAEFLEGIEKSANASEIIDLDKPRAPQNYRAVRLYQLLKAKVTGESIKEAEPKDYVNFDLKGGLSMYAFMQSLAKRAEEKRMEEENNGQPASEKKISKQEELPSFSNYEVALCPAEGGHAVLMKALTPGNMCPKHSETRLEAKDLGREEGSRLRTSFLIKDKKSGKLGWNRFEGIEEFETDVRTEDGYTYRAIVRPGGSGK